MRAGAVLRQDAGYDVSWEVINARCLTAQTRKRLFIVGIRRQAQVQTTPGVPRHQTIAATKAGRSREAPPFTFPYIPDLGLRAADILQPDNEIAASHHDDCSTVDLSVNRYSISGEQMAQLLYDVPSWKPSKLAWPDSVCNTLTSHYGVSIGRGASYDMYSLAILSHSTCVSSPRCDD
jgi:site-specific DNA-cytosine methylase